MDTSYLIINILLIATFLYKNDSIELRYSDYEDSFQFLSHFSLVQKPEEVGQQAAKHHGY